MATYSSNVTGNVDAARLIYIIRRVAVRDRRLDNHFLRKTLVAQSLQYDLKLYEPYFLIVLREICAL